MKPSSVLPAVLSVLFAAAAAASANDVSLRRGKAFTRDAVPKSLSGVTYVGGNRFWAVADDGSEGGLYEFTVDLDADGTNVVAFSICSTNERVRLGTASDLEGCAFDPATGNVWATDEGGRSIREYDAATGEKLRSVPVPDFLANHRYNFGFEALSMRGDGLALWTANEEALECDGPRSSQASGTTVRLAKFSRRSVRDGFELEAMYAYTTDPWKNAYDYNGYSRCGVAGLCALPDGSLLVLERELNFSNTSGKLALALGNYLGWKVFRVARPENATDVKGYASLKDGTPWRGAEKELLASDGSLLFATGNFEGICLGPRLADGNLSVLLISDSGDGYSRPMLYPLVLSGLDVATLDFPAPDASLGADASASVVGSNYRFLSGTRLSVDLSGAAAAAARYAENGSTAALPEWSLASGGASGGGATASFEVSGDDTLLWTGLAAAQPVATAVLGTDTFEEYAVGATVGDLLGPSDLRGWTGLAIGGNAVSAAVESGAPDSVPPGFPMSTAPHERILSVKAARRDYGTPSGGNQKLEMMVRVSEAFGIKIIGDDPANEDENRNDWIAHFLVEDAGGKPKLFHGDGNGGLVRSDLDVGPFEPGEWIRFGVLLDVTTGPDDCAYIEVSVNGTPVFQTNGLASPSNPVSTDGGTWLHAGPDTRYWGGITEIQLIGDDGLAVDDVVLSTAGFPSETAPGFVRADGVPADWIAKRGRDPVFEDLTAPTAIRDGDHVYSLGDAFTAGVDPDGTAPLRETEVELLPDGRVRLSWNGVRADKADPSGAYAVFGAADLASLSTADPDAALPGTAATEGGRTVWTSAAPVGGDACFFRVKATR